MSYRKGFRAFDTSAGWRIGNVESCFSFVGFWPKRRNHRPPIPPSRSFRNVPSARDRYASLNFSPPHRFTIRQRSQFPSPSILLSEGSNTAACMLPWACVAEVCLHLHNNALLSFRKEYNSKMSTFDVNCNGDFGQPCALSLPTPAHSSIEYP